MSSLEISPNKIIILGNGFDISHGLKTSFNNFMLNYLKKTLHNLLNSEIQRDSDGLFYYYLKTPLLTLHSIKWNQFDPNINSDSVKSKINSLNTEQLKYFDSYFNDKDIFYRYTPSDFFKSLILFHRINGWLDFELCYYDLLLDLTKKDDIGGVRNLNNQMLEIKRELITYLKHVNEDLKTLSYNTSGLFNDFKRSYYDSFGLDVFKTNQKVLFLNFNYTNTIGIYKFRKPNNVRIINIHGELEDNLDDIILGYGNEDQVEYPLLERKNNTDYLRNIKSIYYLRKPYYNLLKSFLDSGKYEVKIIGHSCGLSDKILLNQIFENNSCLKIELHHFNINEENSFFDNSINLSKNFNHKLNFRNIVEHFNENLTIPQSPLKEFNTIQESYISGKFI